MLLSLSCLSFPAFADTIHLLDGRSYQGEFIRGDKTSVLFQSGGNTLGFPKKRVLYILFGEGVLQMKEKGGSSTTEEIKIIDEKIKAEILGGDAAIYDVTLQAGVDFQKASEGILAVINENKQKNTDTEAFYLGAYFRAWNSFASMTYNISSGEGGGSGARTFIGRYRGGARCGSNRGCAPRPRRGPRALR